MYVHMYKRIIKYNIIATYGLNRNFVTYLKHNFKSYLFINAQLKNTSRLILVSHEAKK